MRTRITIAGLVVLGACLIGWAALALAQQPPNLPEPAKPGDTGLPTPLPLPLPPPVTPTPIPAPTTGGSAPHQPTPASPTPASPYSPSPLPVTPGPVPTLAPVPGDPKLTQMESEATPPKTASLPGIPAGTTPTSEEQTQATVTPSNTTGRQEPAVSLEWIGPPTAKISQPTEYSLVVRNVSNIPVLQVQVRVRIPQAINVMSTEPKSVNELNVFVWDLGTLMAKQEKVLQMKLQATSKGDLMPQAWVTFTGSSVMRISVREPKLALKTTGNDKVMVGDTANFSLSVSNPGDGSADHVKIHSVLSDGLVHPSKAKEVDFDIGNLAPGETRTVQLLCETKVGGLQTCDAIAEAEGGLIAKDSARVTVSTPRLDLVLLGPGLRYLERKALYTLKVSNPGDAPATNVTVGDVVPDGFKVLAASDGGRHDFSSRTVSWFLGEILPGQTREVKFEVQAINIGEHKHRAHAVAQRGLRAEAELNTRVEGLSALMLEMVDTEDPIEVGGDTGYEIRVTNTGSKAETDIRLIATVPDKMEFKNATGLKYHTEGKTILFDPLEKLAPRADAIIKINVKAIEAGTVRFKIQMTSTNLQEPVIKMEPTRIYSDAPEGKSSTPAMPVAPAGSLVPPGSK